MNKEAMKQQIQEALSKKLGDSFHITIQKVFKTNVTLDGLIIMQDGKSFTPTVTRHFIVDRKSILFSTA